jgi:hypothetical protein
MSNERDDRGQFVEQVTLEDVLSILRRTDEPMTGTEIGTELGISNRAALNKLNTLHEREEIRRKEVGARSVVWWFPKGTSVATEINPDDPFWSTAGMFPTGGPTDVAANADDYLYGDRREQ